MTKKSRAGRAKQSLAPLKLDLGCGTQKKAGYIGVDCRDFPGVDIICDLRDTWKWADESVDEVWCSHTVEHFKPRERIHFVNELHRILKPGGFATITTPHWASTRAYGDLTHEWPPVCESWFFYLKADWRAKEAPHNDEYTCDFDITWGYTLHEQISVRNAEYQQMAVGWYKEACQDMVATLRRAPPPPT